ncbi:class I SAM-dependent methyltransferase [Microvirga makkahensis]|uniref:Methyltransferase domain-containing protein n=1 Tax=Microvirga makkahensis TaxID=1128670 RepID=A0A7X3MQH2_9HYPH|nr:class I SAM-dependent methyltransferase [Microvirga makkahensis]MXQ11367.1 methyltransferase domain-containing protein [Microvirga makkahensis]
MTHSANYDFVISMARLLAQSENPRVLDFGCGRGAIVDLGLSQGLDIFGVDTFDGIYTRWYERLPERLKGRISRIDGSLPYETASFDVVVANQVLEHISEPATVLPEIRRVLKPGGVFMALFPVKETWYEGHAGVYFAHRLQHHPWLLRRYLRLAHRLGLGLYRHGKDSTAWSEHLARTIETACYYHRRTDIVAMLTKTFGSVPRSLASEYVGYRLGSHIPGWIPRSVQDLLFRAVAHARVGVILAVTVPSED